MRRVQDEGNEGQAQLPRVPVIRTEGVRQLRNFFGLATREESPEETLAYHDFRGVLRGDYSERELAALLSVGRDAPVSPERLAGAARAMRGVSPIPQNPVFMLRSTPQRRGHKVQTDMGTSR